MQLDYKATTLRVLVAVTMLISQYDYRFLSHMDVSQIYCKNILIQIRHSGDYRKLVSMTNLFFSDTVKEYIVLCNVQDQLHCYNTFYSPSQKFVGNTF